ncbi:AAA family ATPase [Microbacterium sp. zg.Y625]|uniref:ATP-binding protein n=1 Tax=Microbacterium jiangjiandongii TaxID=3049071 RepID=UPI00214CB702|nr:MULTISPECIES: LuxR family transcriptional regulator [unclassified Microbacterium]MCR2793179.1 AAA family ATPase [Microbacterium sp. zg.Y625]MCR2815644.1 AAA family ATPase [Microbacterium sp. zg.Y843]WIM25441.1 AAA family ATPase [Microbacterium sp. zg-Y625]
MRVHLFGRHAECEALDRALADAHAGRSRALYARGEAGIGKTSLLDYARTAADALGFRVESATGMESESQFAYAALHQLCAPLLEYDATMAGPQRDALAIAFGTKTGPVPDRFLVGLAVLNLLAEAAEERPLLCLVDDAQWLDRASAEVIAFAARRVSAERLALVVAGRDSDDDASAAFSGMPVLTVAALGEADARELLAAETATLIDASVRERVIAEARGNPLALLELPRSVGPATLASGFDVHDRPDVPQHLEQAFRQRSTALPSETQRVLLLAAAEPTGDVALLFRALSRLGIEGSGAAAAETAGLFTIDSKVRFRHPLVRSAIYSAAVPAERRQAHEALAAATDPRIDPDRRAWHRGQAVLGPDEDVAVELERAGERALARGGMAAAAALFQRAAQLTPDPALRTQRAMTALQAKHEAGAADEALKLLALAAQGPLSPLQSARLTLYRAHITFYLVHSDDVPVMFLDAAHALAPLDPAVSREAFLLALNTAVIAGGDVRGVAEAARAAPRPPEQPRPLDLLLDGLVTVYTEGYVAGVDTLRRAVTSLRDEELSRDVYRGTDSDRWLWLASRTAVALFENDLMYDLAARKVTIARTAGAVATLYVALIALSAAHALRGELSRAAELLAESTAIARATDAVPLPHGELFLAAWRGWESDLPELHRRSAGAADKNAGTEVAVANYASAVFHNATGSFATAMTAAQRAVESDDFSVQSVALPELVEAAARAGHAQAAREAHAQLVARAHASGTPWALGLAARSRALITPGGAAEDDYREAIERLGESRLTGHLARAHLLYGEWLRREGRRREAREELRTAHDMLTDMGAVGFAERAAKELRATGEHPRARNAPPSTALTEHELQIARAVATGATSREVAAMLFLSPRTIEAHLRTIFRKLGVTSRRQLRELHL